MYWFLLWTLCCREVLLLPCAKNIFYVPLEFRVKTFKQEKKKDYVILFIDRKALGNVSPSVLSFTAHILLWNYHSCHHYTIMVLDKSFEYNVGMTTAWSADNLAQTWTLQVHDGQNNQNPLQPQKQLNWSFSSMYDLWKGKQGKSTNKKGVALWPVLLQIGSYSVKQKSLKLTYMLFQKMQSKSN